MTEPDKNTEAHPAAPHTGNPPSRVLNFVCTALLLFSAFSLAFVPLRGSQDEWWHLKTGQWIWQHGHLPVNDIFTYTGEDIRWYNHEWLSQLIFYAVFRMGEAISGMASAAFPRGLIWLIAFKSVVVAGAFWLVALLARQRFRVTGGGWAAACVIAVIAADISRRTIYVRPPIFSYVLFALFLLMLYVWKQGRLKCWWLWLLVPLTILWANLHGMVLLSVVAVGAFAGGEFLENLIKWKQSGSGVSPLKENGGDSNDAAPSFLRSLLTPSALFLSALTVLVALACMAQPSGYHIFFLGRNFTADPILQQIILEMKPTPGPFARLRADQPFWDVSNWIARPPGFWTFWVALGAIILLLLRNRLRLPYGADYLLLGFFTYQAVMHWRLLPLFAIAAAGPAASLIAARLQRLPARFASWQQPAFALGLAGLVGWFNFTVAEPPPQTFFHRNLQLLRGQAANTADYPVPLMDYLEQAGLPPRMFSDSNYCGYFMWRLSPERYKMFTDNRFDVFGSQFIWQERAIFFALQAGDILDGRTVTESWDDMLRRHGVNFLVFRPIDRPHLYQALLATDQWRLVYYYIPPQAAPSNYPLEGYYVWLRDSEDAESLQERSEEIFRKQFVNRITPAEIWRRLQRTGRHGRTRTSTD